jgi:hypothetical protein
MATWFPCRRGRTLFILGSLPLLYRLIIYIDRRILWCTHFLFVYCHEYQITAHSYRVLIPPVTLYWFPVQGILSISAMDLESKYCYFYHSWDFVPYYCVYMSFFFKYIIYFRFCNTLKEIKSWQLSIFQWNRCEFTFFFIDDIFYMIIRLQT